MGYLTEHYSQLIAAVGISVLGAWFLVRFVGARKARRRCADGLPALAKQLGLTSSCTIIPAT
ncbi:MAG: hypothetical protein ABI333_29555 [bacterium]